jgi:hypothetical protein
MVLGESVPPRSTSSPDDEEARTDALVSSLPLILSALTLLLGGYVVWATAPRAGPPAFPLWDLLIVLGFIAAIGAGLALARPNAPAHGAEEAETDDSTLPSGSRSDFGRPRPDAVAAGGTAPSGGLAVAMASLGGRPTPPAVWSEDDLPLPVPRAPLPTVPAAGPPSPRSAAARTRNPAVETALAELDDIQRDTTPRRPDGRVASP